MRILVVEDDALLRNSLQVGLSLQGLTVDVTQTCADAEAALATNTFDAMILDIMLPDGSGLGLLRAMRACGNGTPVLLLTARDAVEDRIQGLDNGADDYLGKPFDLEEVAARLRAIRRRADGRTTGIMAWNGLELDPAQHLATVNGNAIALSRREFALLSALMRRPAGVLSKDQLTESLYGWQEDVESNAIEVHVHNVRNKIGKERIETVRGVGYRLRAPA